MYSRIIIIGCDNSGKSRLADDLSKEFGYKITHSPGNVDIDKMVEYMEEFANSEMVISDRFPIIEETIYGPLLRGHSRFTGNEEMMSRAYHALNKADLIILCYPGLFKVLDWGEREQYPGVKDNALPLIGAYNSFAVSLRKLGLNVKEYNYRCDDFKELVQ